MQYLSASETAQKWGISPRRVCCLCGDGRINGAQRTGSYWIIPATAPKPADARLKNGRYRKSDQRMASHVCSH